MTVLVTGAAGFIGSHVSHALLDRGEEVLGLDNLNNYYDPKLKQGRLERLEAREGFKFVFADIGRIQALEAAVEPANGSIDRIVSTKRELRGPHTPRVKTTGNLNGTENP